MLTSMHIKNMLTNIKYILKHILNTFLAVILGE